MIFLEEAKTFKILLEPLKLDSSFRTRQINVWKSRLDGPDHTLMLKNTISFNMKFISEIIRGQKKSRHHQQGYGYN